MGEPLVEVGHIDRPHGLKGDLMVTLITDQVEARTRPGVTFSTDRGPLVIERSSRHQHRHIMTFVGVNDRAAADALAGLFLRAEPLDDPDALWVRDVIGTVVRSLDGTEHGMVVSVLDNPAHPILELSSGALVPTVFVVASGDGVTVIDPPAGLFE